MRVVGIRLDPLYMLLGTVVVAAVFFSIFSPFLPHPYPHQQQQRQQQQKQERLKATEAATTATTSTSGTGGDCSQDLGVVVVVVVLVLVLMLFWGGWVSGVCSQSKHPRDNSQFQHGAYKQRNTVQARQP